MTRSDADSSCTALSKKNLEINLLRDQFSRNDCRLTTFLTLLCNEMDI